jgi:hypothetical protein
MKCWCEWQRGAVLLGKPFSVSHTMVLYWRRGFSRSGDSAAEKIMDKNAKSVHDECLALRERVWSSRTGSISREIMNFQRNDGANLLPVLPSS